jgi:hypothetical protein
LGNPLAVRIGPGKLLIAPLGSTEPDDLATAWDNAWTELGYTKEGSNFVFDQTFENVEVAEELDPVAIIQTKRDGTVNFALAEITADNLSRAFNGGDVQSPGGLTTFEPPSVGDFAYVMLGWESDDVLERWIFRKSLQVGSIDMPRKKGAEKAVIPCSFRCSKPADAPAFKVIFDANYSDSGAGS